MSQTVAGKIYQIKEVEKITEKFSKREFVLEISNNPAYVEKVLFTLIMDKTDLIDNYKVGDSITVNYNLKGREWTSPQGDVRFFNTLEVWKISEGESKVEQPTQEDLKNVVSNDEDGDDLPF